MPKAKVTKKPELGSELKEAVIPVAKPVVGTPGKCCGHLEVTHYGSENRWCNVSQCTCQKWEGK